MYVGYVCMLCMYCNYTINVHKYIYIYFFSDPFVFILVLFAREKH